MTTCDVSSAAAQSALWWIFSFKPYFTSSAEETPSEDILMVALEIVSSALEAKNQNKLDQSETAEDLLLFCALSRDQT